ncbi:MAG TPA: nitrogenase component 1 [Holophaga sp.]|nr:nitrogenase component 1 [Holophaga sp.]
MSLDMESLAALETEESPEYAVNPCKVCAPLGASLAFKGVEGAVPLLHGSQGCATYIRRYLISHFREPVDIASSSFDEMAAVFGGADSLMRALDNVAAQYQPQLIGVATTCLSETIGDDVADALRRYQPSNEFDCARVQVSTPSYSGTHLDGYYATVTSLVESLAEGGPSTGTVNIFPGIVSPSDLRWIKRTLEAFGLEGCLLPDYSDTLDGGQWSAYNRLPPGGTPLAKIRDAGKAAASVELGWSQARRETAGSYLNREFGIPCHSLGLPVGLEATDAFLEVLSRISGRPIPESMQAERARLLDAYVDAHKIAVGQKAVVFGDEDTALALALFLAEIGVEPALVASGGSGALADTAPAAHESLRTLNVKFMPDSDFARIGEAAKAVSPTLLVGHSKGYKLARELDIPLVRVGFPVHDRYGAARITMLGYEGTQRLFDDVVNTILDHRQAKSGVGYFYF